MRNHTKLRAFELADQLALTTCKAMASFPREEQFAPTSQLRRAAVSTASWDPSVIRPNSSGGNPKVPNSPIRAEIDNAYANLYVCKS